MKSLFMDNQCGNCTVSLLISTGFSSSNGGESGEGDVGTSDDRQRQQQQRIAAAADGDDHDDTATTSTDIKTATEMPTTASMPTSVLSLSVIASSGSAGRSASASANNDTPMTRFSDISPSVMNSEGPCLLPTPLTVNVNTNTALIVTGTAMMSHSETAMNTSYTMELKGMLCPAVTHSITHALIHPLTHPRIFPVIAP